MEFLVLATAHFLALLSPGPDFFLIMQASLRLTLRYGLALCGGIACANGAYLVFAVLGLEAIKEMVWLVSTLRYAGAAYLVFLGYLLLRAPRPEPGVEAQGNSSFLQKPGVKHQFFIGFTSAILNPKNAVFYLSLFTVMVSSQTGLSVRILYALWMMSVVFLWDCAVFVFLGQNRVKTSLGRSVYYLEKVTGTVLATFGLILPFT